MVIQPIKGLACAECGGTGGLLRMDDSGPLCLACVDMDHLAFRPSQKYLDWFNIRPGDVVGDISSAELEAGSYARNQSQPGAGPEVSMKLEGDHRRRAGEGER